MILVTGEVLARPETASAIRALALEHVARSRREPGCLSHDVLEDLHNALRLVFVERWADMASLTAHFAVPESRAFARELTRLAAEAPAMQIHQAQPVTL
jgi:quinol monooxygenase YgiN